MGDVNLWQYPPCRKMLPGIWTLFAVLTILTNRFSPAGSHIFPTWPSIRHRSHPVKHFMMTAALPFMRFPLDLYSNHRSPPISIINPDGTVPSAPETLLQTFTALYNTAHHRCLLPLLRSILWHQSRRRKARTLPGVTPLPTFGSLQGAGRPKANPRLPRANHPPTGRHHRTKLPAPQISRSETCWRSTSSEPRGNHTSPVTAK